MDRSGYLTPKFRLAGDRGLLMEFGNTIEPIINSRIRAMAGQLEAEKPLGVVEIIPTYCSIIITYDPLETTPDTLIPRLTRMDQELSHIKTPPASTVELPVCYHESLGPDLQYVAKFHGLTIEKVIEIHTAPLYPIYMIGFTPGFPYLGGLDQELHTPRLASPRSLVPAGSVGIANNQTGIYPIDSPGGWQLIGQCPVKLFDAKREEPILLKAGELLKFIPVSLEKFNELAGVNP